MNNSEGSNLTERLARAREESLDIAELIGLCKGVLADGNINLTEAEFILDWLQARPPVLTSWPADVLYALLTSALEDDLLSPDEEAQLRTLLEEMTGEPVSVMFY